jgi:cytochrome P450
VKTCEVEGITIPSGMLVQANVWALHMDPEHSRSDVDKFDPDK